MEYLNLGCGYHYHPDWTNVDFTSTGSDVIAHDLKKRLPFDDQMFDVVYHSHVLEHLPKADALPFLQECFRVLRPQGILRVVIPDLEQIARLYIQALEKASFGSQEWSANYDWILLELYDQTVRNYSGGEMADYLAQKTIANEKFVLDRMGIEGEKLVAALRQVDRPTPFQWSSLSESEAVLHHLLGDRDYLALQIGRFRQSGEVHQWMYDRYSLQKLLEAAGFEQVKVCQAQESAIANFAQFHLDVEPDGRVRKPDSLFVEAVKSTSAPALPVSLANYQDVPPQPLEALPQFQTLVASIDQLTQQLQQSQKQLKQTQVKLGQAQSIIEAMESSKFWKLRSLWFRLKQLISQAK